MKTKNEKTPRTRFGKGFRELVRRYFAHDIARDSAALSYYLLFALFPLLVLISYLVSLLHLNIESTTRMLSQVIPGTVVDVIESYLYYVSKLRSPRVLWFCAIFSIWFPMRAIRTLTHSVRKAFGQDIPTGRLRNTLRIIMAAMILIIVISLSLGLVVVGRRVLELVDRFITLEDWFITAWNYGRFVILFITIMLSFAAIYSLALGKRLPWHWTFPGVSFSVGMGMLLSMLFSYYVEHFGQYSILYGSIATAMVALLWLYMTSNVLIIGSELSAMVVEKQQKTELPEGGTT